MLQVTIESVSTPTDWTVTDCADQWAAEAAADPTRQRAWELKEEGNAHFSSGRFDEVRTVHVLHDAVAGFSGR